ncbi:TPA: DUF551 domain-containing protein [Escherichia coli]|nr:DUF551 domain-containing protein [Escherichia coli]
MTTFTDKELIKEIKERISSLDVRDNIERRAYEIALASLEAEPVAWQVTITKDGQDSASTIYRDCAEKDTWVRIHETLGSVVHVTPLYMAPPAPVIQADVAQAIENLKQKLVECNRYNYCADAVKGVEDACHAAMLQGSQPVSQTYKFPVNTPCQDAPAHIWLQTAGVWPEDGELSELTWCSHNQHHDDTLYVRADLVNGNSPVTPDGWISCSERMPAQDDWILIYSKHGEYMAGQVQGEYVELSDGTLSWLGNALFWMLLPEPPQEAGQ